MVKKYVKKPVEIEAILWNGSNQAEIIKFCTVEKLHSCHAILMANGDLIIGTLEGQHLASNGDYIIKGIKGEFYPCKPDIFELTYSEVK